MAVDRRPGERRIAAFVGLVELGACLQQLCGDPAVAAPGSFDICVGVEPRRISPAAAYCAAPALCAGAER